MSQYTFFWKPHESNGFLSNCFQSPFVEYDLSFSSTEQYMMYHKAMLFEDTKHASMILNATNPATMKRLGRAVTNFDETTWNNQKCVIMRVGGANCILILKESGAAAL